MAQIERELLGFETPKKQSSCRLVLESSTPCESPKFLYMVCYAWYKIHRMREPFSMRQVFVEGLNEAREIWEKCETR